MLGYTLREIIGKHQHELIHYHYIDGSPFPVQACPDLWLRDQRNPAARRVLAQGWHGTPVDYTSAPIEEGRRVVAVIVTVRDVTVEQEARRQVVRLAAEWVGSRTDVTEQRELLAALRPG